MSRNSYEKHTIDILVRYLQRNHPGRAHPERTVEEFIIYLVAKRVLSQSLEKLYQGIIDSKFNTSLDDHEDIQDVVSDVLPPETELLVLYENLERFMKWRTKHD